MSDDDSTPNEELYKLLIEWKTDAAYMEYHSDKYAHPKKTEGAAEVMKDLADELEAVIDDDE